MRFRSFSQMDKKNRPGNEALKVERSNYGRFFYKFSADISAFCKSRKFSSAKGFQEYLPFFRREETSQTAGQRLRLHRFSDFFSLFLKIFEIPG